MMDYGTVLAAIAASIVLFVLIVTFVFFIDDLRRSRR